MTESAKKQRLRKLSEEVLLAACKGGAFASVSTQMGRHLSRESFNAAKCLMELLDEEASK